MAIIKKITQPGDFQLSTLNGRVRLESGRLATYDADGKVVTISDQEGLTTYDADGKVMLRSGTNPNDTKKITVIGRQGEDALANI